MTKSTPSHLTVVLRDGAVTLPGIGWNSAGRVLVYGDDFEVTPELLDVLGDDWVDRAIASGRYVAGDLDANPEVRKRREDDDTEERARLDRYQRTGL